MPPAQAIQQTIDRSTSTPMNQAVSPQPVVLLTDVSPGVGGILNGRFPLQLGLTVQGYYDDNIYVQPSGPGKVSDFIWSLSPLLAWNSAEETGASNSVQVAYSPTLIFYQDHSENDAVNQSAKVVYAYDDDRLQLLVAESYASFQENSADYERLGTETSSVTSIQCRYQLTGKTNLNFFAQQNYTKDSPGLESTERTFSSYIDYQCTPKTTFGLGGVVGAADLEGPNQTFEQGNLRVDYEPTAKLNFNLTAGGEFRQTQGHGGSIFTPDFALAGAYEPFDGTSFGISAYRRYDYSGQFYGDDYLATGVSIFVTQRFFHRFHLSLAGSFENAKYRDNFSNSQIDQGYDYFSLEPELTFTPFTGCDFKTFYQYRQALAEGPVSAFSDNQVGFSASFTY